MNKFLNEAEISSLVSKIKTFEMSKQERNDLYDTTTNSSCLTDLKRLNPFYIKLANDIASHIDALNLNVNKTKNYTNIVRVVINSIGGLVWNDKSSLNDEYSVSFCRFLLYLRTLLRHSLAVVMITVPNEIATNLELIEKYTHLADYVFHMDDSKSTVSRLTQTQYDGLFRILKLPNLNSLNAYQPETLDLAFFLKRKRLVIEQLHLPPDLGENDDSQKGRTSTSLKVSCASSSSTNSSNAANSKLDF
jgi:elongator complex protein 4